MGDGYRTRDTNLARDGVIWVLVRLPADASLELWSHRRRLLYTTAKVESQNGILGEAFKHTNAPQRRHNDETRNDRSCGSAGKHLGRAQHRARAQTFKVEKFDIKGEGGTDYVAVEAVTGRVFVSRGTHMMVVEGATGKVLGDIPNTPGVHGAGIATKAGHGFTTNGGDQTVTMFDLKTLAVIKQIKARRPLLRASAFDIRTGAN